ncbi:cilia- and flagella-associated protein 70 [Chanos chanos]|uniref:Cilia- and flagella-associated protein 70 n=1 Tax=Chanos chanos TaxID=29144 RepID=A0A6J2WMR9_CHACN|nr:cilia- and flagella-associated protein 70 [Chanos chanos]
MNPSQGTELKSVLVQITVQRGNNMRGSKTESLLSFVRAEFSDTVLGESQRIDALVDEVVHYNFTCSFECSEFAYTLDDVAHKPVLLTVIEVLPKEKKQKEEKTAIVGQAVVDLLPLLQGQCSLSSSLLLYPTSGSLAETASQDESIKPTLDVTICVCEPLLSDIQIANSNLLKVTVETAYSVPEVWNQVSGNPSSYVAALQVPLTAAKEQVLMFSNGVLKVGGEREPFPRPKKWPLGPLQASGAQFIPDSIIESSEMEYGDLTSAEDREFRAEAECNRLRVCWDTERRCFIDAGGAACLAGKIVECRLWPVEIMRSTQAGAAKGGKAGKEKPGEDETQISFHGVAYVDMAPLLYPGVKCIRGAYRLYPFYESDLLIKAKRNISSLRESIRAPATHTRGRVPSSVGSCKVAQSKVFEAQKGGKDAKESPKKGKPAQADSVTEVEPQVNVEGQMYADSKSYIIIEIALEKPLVPKRPPEELAKRVMELIPPRPPLPRRPAGADRAVQEYQAQVANVVTQILDQYQQLFGAAFALGAKLLDPSAQEQCKRQILGELNYSGKYFAFKEQLKYSVVRIVREKMLRTEAFTDPAQLQAFLSQLYVFLVDQMHVTLNKTLSVDAQETQPQPLLDCAQLRHFAREAQMNQDHKLAAQYYQERVARDRSNPDHWFDYGTYHMLVADFLKAEECFHQAVSIYQAHLPSLLMCGILAEMNGRYEDAETFFEGATCVDTKSVVAWTLFGLFYQAQEKSIQAEMAFLEATKQLRAAVFCSPRSQPESGRDEEKNEETTETTKNETGDHPCIAIMGNTENAEVGSHSSQDSDAGKETTDPEPAGAPHKTAPIRNRTSIYMETVQFLLENGASQMAQRALAQELLCPERSPSSFYHLALARLQLLKGEYRSAEASLRQALTGGFENPDVWATYGHLHFLTEDHSQAQKCYERTLDFVTDASDTHLIYLRLGSIYLQQGQFEKAKMTYLRACKSSPSCLTWLGLGIACYRLGDMTEAEVALTEANTLNNGNPDVWAYLSLVCLQTSRKLEAEQSYKYAIKLNLKNESLLQEIKELQIHVGFGNPCF